MNEYGKFICMSFLWGGCLKNKGRKLQSL